jgi:hypothetical protein
MSEKLDPKAKVRKPYKKPEVVRVALRPDEAVLGNCKSGSAVGPGGAGNCTHVGPCFSQGS